MDYKTVKEAKRQMILTPVADSVTINGYEFGCSICMGIDEPGEFYVGLTFPAIIENIKALKRLFQIKEPLSIESAKLRQSGYIVDGLIVTEMNFSSELNTVTWDCIGLGDTKSFS